MTKEQYMQWSSFCRCSKKNKRALNTADKWITGAVFFSYPAFLLYIYFYKSLRGLFFHISIPAISFLAVSLFRKLYSAPRPYELWDIVPLLNKNTKGKSFPSRHVFSVFILGMAYFYEKRFLGVTVFLAGLGLSFIRVIGGVHFPKDVVAGAALGILFGMCFWILNV